MSFSANERDRELCRNISEAHTYIIRYIADINKSEFLADAKTQDAVAMRLQQILECAAKLSPELKDKLEISWASLIAMRNKISHSYVDVDVEIVWEVINDFTEFKKLITFTKKNL